MKKIFGYTIFTAQEILLQEQLAAQKLAVLESKLAVSTQLAKKAMDEIDFYRKKYEEVVNRADRQLDAFMASAGLPEVTDLGHTERVEREKKAEINWKQRETELAELYSETMNNFYSDEGLELPEDLKAESDKMVADLGAEKQSEKNG